MFRSRAVVPHRPGAEELFDGLMPSLNGDEHLRRRRSLASLFTSDAMQRYERDVFAPALWSGLVELRDHAQADGDLMPVLRHATMQVAAAVVGLDGLEDPHASEELAELGRTLARGLSVAHSDRRASELLSEAHEAIDLFRRRFYEPSVRRREELLAASSRSDQRGGLPDDLLLVQLRGGSTRSDDLRCREALGLVNAAVFSTPQAIAAAFVLLDDWLAAGHVVPIQDRPLLQQISLEALRLHDTANPFFLRRAIEDVELLDGACVQTGEVVKVDAVAANRDASFYGEEPDRFDPYRGVAFPSRWFGFAFGGGPHMCMGRPLVTGPSSSVSENSLFGLLPTALEQLLRAGIKVDRARDMTYASGMGGGLYQTVPVTVDTNDRQAPLPPDPEMVELRRGRAGGDRR